MAISSVARQATVRKDNTILDVMSLVGKQQAIAGRLALDKQKAEQAAIKQKNEETSKNLKPFVIQTALIAPGTRNSQIGKRRLKMSSLIQMFPISIKKKD